MKRILALCCTVVLTSCFNPKRDCKEFHTGIFEFQTYLNGDLVTSRFIRNDSIEIEKFRGKTDTSSIRWVNDCEYILRNLNPKNRAEKQPIHIKILTTSKNGYTFEYGQVGDPKKAKGEVVRVNRD